MSTHTPIPCASEPLAFTLLPVHGPGEHVGRFLTRAKGPEGAYTLYPQDTVNQDCLVQIHFQPALPEGMSQMEAFKLYETQQNDPAAQGQDYLAAQLRLGENVLGYVTTLNLALGVLNKFRGKSLEGHPEGAEARLIDQGYVFQHEIQGGVRVYHKPWKKRGVWIIFTGPSSIHLMFEKNKATCWHNLARFKWAQEAEGCGEVFWPATFADPASVGLLAALSVAEAWDPEQIYAR